MRTKRLITEEATAIFKGVEMTHGNSAHYLTFELNSGERIYFQVSMKCYMLILEGDQCLITYNMTKKKLKSFEVIGGANVASVSVGKEEASEVKDHVEKTGEPSLLQRKLEESRRLLQESSKTRRENKQ
ncbi:MAG: DUF2500 domain-containing protein [Defluviitaleaceae bacterium]|nr:DUF2500 domain-containing protein [Defluviitaleaceae bacterium]